MVATIAHLPPLSLTTLLHVHAFATEGLRAPGAIGNLLQPTSAILLHILRSTLARVTAGLQRDASKGVLWKLLHGLHLGHSTSLLSLDGVWLPQGAPKFGLIVPREVVIQAWEGDQKEEPVQGSHGVLLPTQETRAQLVQVQRQEAPAFNLVPLLDVLQNASGSAACCQV